MKKIKKLDVLVVYSAAIAPSATVLDTHSKKPFLVDSARANYNVSYAYFLNHCKTQGLSAGFTSSSDITGPGTCSSYWTQTPSGWTKVNHSAQSNQIFDKLSPSSTKRAAERTLLLSDNSVTPFNDPTLFQIFYDKLVTYRQFSDYAIPTSDIYSSRPRDIHISITRLRKLLREHPFPDDFSTAIVLKDRFGAGGNHVYKVSTNMPVKINQIMLENPKIKFVIQPFLHFDKGYTYKNRQAATDIRLIIQHNQLLQCYIRIAKGDDFRCNQHQGGELIYLTDLEIPPLVNKIASKLMTKINKPHSLYALDFVISNAGRVYFIEGNSNPGIDWTLTSKLSQNKGQRLIRRIISELTHRVNTNHS